MLSPLRTALKQEAGRLKKKQKRVTPTSHSESDDDSHAGSAEDLTKKQKARAEFLCLLQLFGDDMNLLSQDMSKKQQIIAEFLRLLEVFGDDMDRLSHPRDTPDTRLLLGERKPMKNFVCELKDMLNRFDDNLNKVGGSLSLTFDAEGNGHKDAIQRRENGEPKKFQAMRTGVWAQRGAMFVDAGGYLGDDETLADDGDGDGDGDDESSTNLAKVRAKARIACPPAVVCFFIYSSIHQSFNCPSHK